jgi:dipeptidyl aminopeptidase/acylaminoacyl peptidase
MLSVRAKGKMLKSIALTVLTILCVGDVRCVVPARTTLLAQASESRQALPDLGKGQRVEPGIMLYEVKVPGKGAANKLWVYLPEGQTQPKIPCVLIAPAGTRLFHGITLAKGDRPEHLPYVRAGFAVVAYEVDGPLADNASGKALLKAAGDFKNAEAGLVNARAALDYALAKIPQIDPSRIYIAGHSSAGTISLLVAEREPRVRAAVAYAPAPNVEKFLGEDKVAALASIIPDYREFLKRTSPHAGAAELRCPLFLFHAEDDKNVAITESEAFAKEVSRHNPSVTFVRAAKGGHFSAMLDEGIPKAIEWLKALK